MNYTALKTKAKIVTIYTIGQMIPSLPHLLPPTPSEFRLSAARAQNTRRMAKAYILWEIQFDSCIISAKIIVLFGGERSNVGNCFIATRAKLYYNRNHFVGDLKA